MVGAAEKENTQGADCRTDGRAAAAGLDLRLSSEVVNNFIRVLLDIKQKAH